MHPYDGPSRIDVQMNQAGNEFDDTPVQLLVYVLQQRMPDGKWADVQVFDEIAVERADHYAEALNKYSPYAWRVVEDRQ